MYLKQCLGFLKLILLLYAVPRARIQKGNTLNPAMYPKKLMLILQVQTPPRNTGPVLKHFLFKDLYKVLFFPFVMHLHQLWSQDIYTEIYTFKIIHPNIGQIPKTPHTLQQLDLQNTEIISLLLDLENAQ